jgi:hypothetical protein
MINKTFYKYVINNSLLDLIGVKEEEIIEINNTLSIKIRRGGKEYYIDINGHPYASEDKGITLQLYKYYEKDGITISLLRVENIRNEDGFKKFRTLLEEMLKEPVVVVCDNDK